MILPQANPLLCKINRNNLSYTRKVNEYGHYTSNVLTKTTLKHMSLLVTAITQPQSATRQDLDYSGGWGKNSGY